MTENKSVLSLYVVIIMIFQFDVIYTSWVITFSWPPRGQMIRIAVVLLLNFLSANLSFFGLNLVPLTAHFHSCSHLLVSFVCSFDFALQGFGLDFLLVSNLITETQGAFD